MVAPYCVYAHLTSDTDELFYIGKGKARRPFTKHNRNLHWHRIVNKHGFTVKLLAQNLSEDEAFNLEQNLIIKYKAENLCKANYVDGGRGIPGYKHTEETRKKIGESSKLRNSNPTAAMLEGRKKISIAKTQQWRDFNSKMHEGAKRSGLARSGRTKSTHPGVARMAQKMSQKFSGSNNPNHKWLWKTPYGDFVSSYEAARHLNIGRKTVERRCKKNCQGWKKVSWKTET